jgi:tetratricopeptide (TPR) repeat protein
MACGLILVLAACASTNQQRPADLEDRAVVDGEVLPLPDQQVISAEPLNGAPPVSAVVKRLMASAQAQRDQGNWDAAAGSLERALRIEPRNAILWGRLADVRFEQRAWRNAIQLAAKSNTLAGNNITLKRQNWYLMANAYEALGDQINAQKFRSKLNDY